MSAEFEAPLVLTTPRIRGPRVKDAQWLLAGHNRFDGLATYKDGKVDGVWGPLSAQAAARAWYWLGAPEAQQVPAFTQKLYEYLRPDHWRELPKSWQEARAARVAAAAATPGLLAMRFGEQYEGYHEGPRSNETIFGKWYGWDLVAWCAIYESFCCGHTGRPKFHYASVELIYWDAVYGRNGLYVVRTPQPGDFALYRFGGDRWAHTGFVEQVIEQGVSFQDLSGNTSSANFQNGGYVEKHERQWSTVTAFARLR
jgi:hypothetical protein